MTYGKIIHNSIVAFLAVMVLCSTISCRTSSPDQPNQGSVLLRWAEKPSARGPSTRAQPEDVTRFDFIVRYDKGQKSTFSKVKKQIREGDVIAYWLKTDEARKAILKGSVNKVGYRLFDYGHLAMVVRDPREPSRLCLLSSESFKGVHTKDGLDSLQEHSCDIYRLNQWHRVDQLKLKEFTLAAEKRAGKWYGYDFSAMFALWNSNLKPKQARDVGHDYICSTVVVAALYYSGVELDAVQRLGLGDLVSPKQVVTSKGRVM